ncbi:hydantoinase/oxoprolinase family protein [Ruminococcus gauvreauii]|uniref:Hydantoinase/oxoprolinase family protein n=1 Tax=Ruminococcus gauvreauii TaxID=438033 RepID=A0ABY5VK87_9FIRM|nr:hydantoinase/oxoprolinase family protein [Ruminococcus gauvreauii]UWP61015.1 hydantoinase/oxoprolinase family protein [Ruminococcus gauvreauii]
MLILGVDTGGTYTDGVIMDRDTGTVVHTAKALTTQYDLTVGIRNCMDALGFESWQQIDMVSLSTTLATNAIVEGKGSRVGLLLLGGRPDGEVPADISAELPARVDIRGGISRPLDESELDDKLAGLRHTCDAVAISGYASIRNPEHERQAARRVAEVLDLPVVCAHELSGSLGFYERTVTAVLNARLIPIIRNLITTVYDVMRERGIRAPVMIVRGDGSLMRADYAVERPVETVLSGPAASVIGARFLSGCQDCLVVDMGGTTTDIACLQNGQCKVSEEGTCLAGWRTRVKALEICTFGLGGDSEIRRRPNGTIQIGPRRVVPLCRAGMCSGKSGLTPTDILHVTGEYVQWESSSSVRGIEVFAQKAAAGAGIPALQAAQKLRGKIVEKLAKYCRESVDVFGNANIRILVGAGAPAPVWLRDAAARLGMRCDIPEHAGVANAVGAAVGQIIETSAVLLRRNKWNESYYIYTEKERLRALTYDRAKELAHHLAYQYAEEKAKFAGAADFHIDRKEWEVRDQDGTFVEWHVQATAVGYP